MHTCTGVQFHKPFWSRLSFFLFNQRQRKIKYLINKKFQAKIYLYLSNKIISLFYGEWVGGGGVGVVGRKKEDTSLPLPSFPPTHSPDPTTPKEGLILMLICILLAASPSHTVFQCQHSFTNSRHLPSFGIFTLSSPDAYCLLLS